MPKRQPSIDRTSFGVTESAGADALTVAWMLTVVIGLVAEIGAVVAIWYFNRQPEAKSVGAMGGVLYFTAVVAAIVSLILVVVVYKVRRVPPPLAITIFALLTAAAPLLATLIGMLK